MSALSSSIWGEPGLRGGGKCDGIVEKWGANARDKIQSILPERSAYKPGETA